MPVMACGCGRELNTFSDCVGCRRSVGSCGCFAVDSSFRPVMACGCGRELNTFSDCVGCRRSVGSCGCSAVM